MFSALSEDDSDDYEIVKAVVLNAYGLVPEAYRKKFRSLKKSDAETFGEFARQKVDLFQRWCRSKDVTTFDDLCQLVLIEKFLNGIPQYVRNHVETSEVTLLVKVAEIAEKYSVNHPPRPSSPRNFGAKALGTIMSHLLIGVGITLFQCVIIVKRQGTRKVHVFNS